VTGRGARATGDRAANAPHLPGARRRRRPVRRKDERTKPAHPLPQRAVIEVKKLKALLGEQALESIPSLAAKSSTHMPSVSKRESGKAKSRTSKAAKTAPNKIEKTKDREEEIPEPSLSVDEREDEDALLARLKAELARVTAEHEAAGSIERIESSVDSNAEQSASARSAVQSTPLQQDASAPTSSVVQTSTSVYARTERRDGFFGFATQAEQHAVKREKQRLLRLELGKLIPFT
jgi:hypothetical protein